MDLFLQDRRYEPLARGEVRALRRAGWSHRQIALRLQIPVGTSRSRAFEARMQIGEGATLQAA